MDAKGKVFKYGDNIDTDVIIAARFLNSSDPEVLAAHCMEEIDPDFRKNVKKGDIIISGDIKLNDELKKEIDEVLILSELEDIYRPYKPKKRTRATIAKEKGLEPLASYIYSQQEIAPLHEKAHHRAF